MHLHQVDPASGVRLIGGELQGWSDADALHASPALARVVSAALPKRASRVLLAGPLAESLLSLIPADVSVDLLVRGLDDARALAGRVSQRPSSTVLCGALDRLPGDSAYSLVVAFGGPGLLLAPDSHPLDGAAVLARVAALVEDGGVLVADVANTAGLHTLLGTKVSKQGNDEWFHGSADFGGRELSLPQLETAVANTGLAPAALYAGYPSPKNLSILAERRAFDRPVVASTVRTLITVAEWEHFGGEIALLDPWGTTERLVDAGLGLATAPAWVVVACRGADPRDLPLVIASEPHLVGAFARVTTVPAATSAPARVASGLLRRDPAVPLSGVAGPLLESLLRQACTQGSLDRIRELLRRYAGWLRDEGAWDEERRASRVFATPANVVVAEDGALALFDPSWAWDEDVDSEYALARGLRDVAHRLVACGVSHPWAPNVTAEALAEELAVMAEADWPPVTGQLENVEAAIAAASPRHATYSRSVQQDQAQAQALRLALDERDRQVTWLEGTLRARDRQVRTLQRAVAVENSVAYKAIHNLTRPGPALKRRVRAALDRRGG